MLHAQAQELQLDTRAWIHGNKGLSLTVMRHTCAPSLPDLLELDCSKLGIRSKEDAGVSRRDVRLLFVDRASPSAFAPSFSMALLSKL